jgi:hypothetical protein
MKTTVSTIEWKEPWRAIQFAAEIGGVQKQLDREITSLHPLFGKGATVVGRRIDNDDVLVVLDDGTYVNVHLVWASGSGPGAFSNEYPSWFSYGSLESFTRVMHEDAAQYGDQA